MNVTIAIPDNNLAEKLIPRYDDIKFQFDLKLLRVSETRVLDLLVSEKAQIALISPFEYGKALKKLDLRIIPVNALSAISFTGFVDIILKSSLEKIENFIIDSKWTYLGIIAFILMKEKYNQHPVMNITLTPFQERDYDLIVTEHNVDNGILNLDVSEEWYDLYEVPLPIYFWVCRAEENINDIELIVKSLLGDKIESYKIKEEQLSEKNYYPREGQLLCDFSEEFHKSLDFVLQNLYFHQFISDIPEIKILGRDGGQLDSNIIKIDKIDI